MPEPDPVADLRDRLEATREAAERLADQARREGSGRRVPPRGWDVPRQAEEADAELQALVGMVAALREVMPPELREQVAELVRQLLLLLRAILDWWLDRLERPAADGRAAGGGADVEDIPIS